MSMGWGLVLVHVLKFPNRVWQKSPQFLECKKKKIIIILIYKTFAGQFVMSHGSYDLSLDSEKLILGGNIRSRICSILVTHTVHCTLTIIRILYLLPDPKMFSLEVDTLFCHIHIKSDIRFDRQSSFSV